MAEQDRETRKLTALRRAKWKTLADYDRRDDHDNRGRRKTPPITLSTMPLWNLPVLEDDSE